MMEPIDDGAALAPGAPTAPPAAANELEASHEQDKVNLEAELQHPERRRARRASISIALRAFEQVGHDTTMEERPEDERGQNASPGGGGQGASPGGDGQNDPSSGGDMPDTTATAMTAPQPGASGSSKDAAQGGEAGAPLLVVRQQTRNVDRAGDKQNERRPVVPGACSE